jgi:hypothetical protein
MADYTKEERRNLERKLDYYGIEMTLIRANGDYFVADIEDMRGALIDEDGFADVLEEVGLRLIDWQQHERDYATITAGL